MDRIYAVLVKWNDIILFDANAAISIQEWHCKIVSYIKWHVIKWWSININQQITSTKYNVCDVDFNAVIENGAIFCEFSDRSFSDDIRRIDMVRIMCMMAKDNIFRIFGNRKRQINTARTTTDNQNGFRNGFVCKR